MKSSFEIYKYRRLSFVLCLFSFLLLVVYGCKKPQAYQFSVDATSDVGSSSIKKINIFLETSVSMQGYVNTNISGNYVLKDVFPYLLIDLDNTFPELTTLYTITDQPKKSTTDRNSFIGQLRSGNIFGGKSSKLQDVFGAVIDSLNDSSINILVSDCISDLGRENTMTEGSKIAQTIYAHLSQKKDVGVAVFQYSSDFNGTYYFDRDNSGGRNEKGRPYYNTILKNRPFYVWVLGNKNLVNQLLVKDVFKSYERSHFYNLPLSEINAQILTNPKKGKVSINEEKQTVRIKAATAKRPVEFVIGVDLNGKPQYYRTLFSDPELFKIDPDFLNAEMKLTTTDLAILEEKNVDKTFIDKNKLTNFIKVNMLDADPNLGAFSITLPSKAAAWFDTIHLDDDLGLPAEAIEGKTFAFKYITEAFDRYYKDQGHLLKFNFTKTK